MILAPLALLALVAAGPAPEAPSPAPPPAPSAPAGAWLGVFLGDSVDGGAPILAVVPGGPAERAGVRPEDVLVAVGETPVAARAELVRVLERSRPGEQVVLGLLRDGRRLALPVLLGRTGDALAPLGIPRSGAAEASGLEVAEIPAELRTHYGAPAGSGVLVARVEPESPAARAGVRVGDVLVRAGDQPVTSGAQLEVRTRLRRPGEPLPLDLVRSGKPVRVALPAAPAPRKEEVEARAARIQAEIERLRARIDALTRELQTLREMPPEP